jgi:GTP-binding protein EngB required for normal cell division
VFRKHKLSSTSITAAEALQGEAQQFEVLVPLVGSFNAGKTSLVNALLGEDALPTGIRPETTIATEIRFASRPGLQFFSQNGQRKDCAVEDLPHVDTSQWLYARFFTASLPPPGLEEVVLVDMPGLDSGVETHNKAILNYIHRGVFFVVVVDVEDGTLKQRTLSFLRELCLYKLSFGVVVNKADKKPTTEVEQVVEHIRKVIVDIAGGPVPVAAASAAERQTDGLRAILRGVDGAAIFNEEFCTQLRGLINGAMQELDLRMGSVAVDAKDLERTVKQFQAKRHEASEKLRCETQRLERELGPSEVARILDEAKRALRGASGELAQASKAGNEAFSHAVNDILRPVLVSTTNAVIEEGIAAAYAAAASATAESDAVLAGLGNRGDKFISQWPGMKVAIADSAQTMGSVIEQRLKSDRTKAVYKTVTGVLAITTTIVAPWIEVVILFLPEILSMIGKFMRDPEAEQAELRNRIEVEAIPRIIAKLRPTVEESLTQALADAREQLKEAMETEDRRICEALDQAKDEHKAKRADGDRAAAEMQDACSALQQILALLPAALKK